MSLLISESIGVASDLVPAPNQTLALVKTIPQLPSLEELKSIVAAGAPTERIRRLPEMELYSNCETLLSGSGSSLLFKSVLAVIQNAGVSRQNLRENERQFLLAATSLHIALKIEQGNFTDLDGVTEWLEFLSVQQFAFSDEYLAVIRFWLNEMPNSMFFLSTSTRIDSSTGELDYMGANYRNRVFEPNSEKREALKADFQTRDYRLAILKQGQFSEADLTTPVMSDFFRVRGLLYTLRYNNSKAALERALPSATNLQSLLPLLKSN